ncbi:AhpC/TSA family protein [Fulvivirga maritima]|uniref:TlpA disulfide reductase family protein n=1 Tax=Fulvivirga maritima TaxID=2904247 RepID=UPI001F492409|nr:TlpA disulfide reductase family protein [Fulvivirga maritima]UII26019.1 AhpC/TSA family protein [Fulvivirga maritima]
MKTTIFLFVLVQFCACNHNPKDQFSIQGKTHALKDGTVLYLDNADSQITDLLDSAIVINNTFTFNTQLPDFPYHAVLRTKGYEKYRFIWLENTAMEFDATNMPFERALVSGSETEEVAQKLRLTLDTLTEEEQEIAELEFVKSHPESIVSAEILYLYYGTFDKEKTAALFQNFTDKNKASKYGKVISNFLKLNQNLQLGDKYVNFEMSNEEGNLKSLAELEGKTILLDFWASWCAPCRKESPELLKVYKTFHPKGFEIFAVSLDENKNRWMEAIQNDSLIWLHVNDFKGQSNLASLIYGVDGIPDNFLIDKNGTIVGRDLHGDILNDKLELLLYNNKRETINQGPQ